MESESSSESIKILKYRGVRYKPVPEEDADDAIERYVVWGPEFVERLWREGGPNHYAELAVIDELPETEYNKVVEIAAIAGFTIINPRKSPHLLRIQWCEIDSLDQLNSIQRQFQGQAVLVHVDDNVPWDLYQEILYEAVLKGYVVTNSGPHRDKDKYLIPLDKSKFEVELADIRQRTDKEIKLGNRVNSRRRFLLGYETATAQAISESFGWYMGAAEREVVAEDTIKSVDEELNGLREELKDCESFLNVTLRDYENIAGRCMEELQQKMSSLVADNQRVARAESMLKDRLQQEATRNLKVIDMGQRNIWKMGKKYMWSCIGISTSVALFLLVSAHCPKVGESKLHLRTRAG